MDAIPLSYVASARGFLQNRSAGRRAFTLVELLAVIAIMAGLMALTIPAIKGPSESRKLQTAADLISGMTTLARQNSLGQNVLTAIVVLGKNAPEKRGLRSIALFELRAAEDGAPRTSNDWKQITVWRQIPEGVLVDDAASTFFDTPLLLPSPALPAQIRVMQTTTNDYHYHVFQPNGRLMSPATVTFKIVPGLLENGAILKNSASASTNYITLSLIGTTGQVKFSQP